MVTTKSLMNVISFDINQKMAVLIGVFSAFQSSMMTQIKGMFSNRKKLTDPDLTGKERLVYYKFYESITKAAGIQRLVLSHLIKLQ